MKSIRNLSNKKLDISWEKDFNGIKNLHVGVDKKHVKIFFNWRPFSFRFGVSIAISRYVIEVSIGIWFNLSLVIIY